MWPQFRSPLIWDVFAVSTYGTVSALFWFVGLVPDLATLRDRAVRAGNKLAAKLYGVFSLGWRGSAAHWRVYEHAYLLLAAISTPLVLSVHSIVSFDFAVSVLPGWHTTIFPPYFVAGAIFSGFAMVITLMVIARYAFRIEHLVTIKHLENMCKIILLTGTIVGYAYGTEFFIAWYSGNGYERFTFLNRALGPYAWAYWTMLTCNVMIPQIFWFKKARTNVPADVRDLDLRQHRDVVRALRDHRDLAAPRLSALELGLLPADLGGHPDLLRNVRPVPYAVPVLHPVPADDRDLGSEGHDGQRQDAPPVLQPAAAPSTGGFG